MRTLDIGQDLDGVNFWFDHAYHHGCVSLGILPAGTPKVRAEHWDFYEDYGHDTAAFIANCHAIADAGLLWEGPMIAGARFAWNELADAGHRIHVITDRSFGTHPVASHVGTRMWLRQHQLRHTSLTFSSDKTIVPTDIMLEDKLQNYDALAATSCTPVLINRPWNADPGDTRLRIDTHEEFVALVADLAAQEQAA